ncbi:hypothetical protein [Streptomyces sp. NPDC101237]|uniref:hypothetical protein n=1 Tax=Streptomyces sp. NPDC101237 TaxID=3366139 RepID=UPI003818CA0F
MTVAIATLYAALLVEVFTLARVGVYTLMPEQPVKHDKTYSGARTRATVRERMIREAARSA